MKYNLSMATRLTAICFAITALGACGRVDEDDVQNNQFSVETDQNNMSTAELDQQDESNSITTADTNTSNSVRAPGNTADPKPVVGTDLKSTKTTTTTTVTDKKTN